MDWMESLGFVLPTLAVLITYWFNHRDVYRLSVKLDGLSDKVNNPVSGLDSLSIKVDKLSDKVNDPVSGLDSLSGKLDKLSNRVDGLSDRVDGLSNRVDGLSDKVNDPVSGLGGLSGKLDKLSDRVNNPVNGLDSVGGEIRETRSLLSSLIGYLHGRFGGSMSEAVGAYGVANSHSPAVLTEKGEKIAARVGARAMVEKYRKHLEIPESANKLLIQDICFSFASMRFLAVVSRSDMEIIEEEIYENGGKREMVLVVYGLLFRDSFLAERGLPVPERKDN